MTNGNTVDIQESILNDKLSDYVHYDSIFGVGFIRLQKRAIWKLSFISIKTYNIIQINSAMCFKLLKDKNIKI